MVTPGCQQVRPFRMGLIFDIGFIHNLHFAGKNKCCVTCWGAWALGSDFPRFIHLMHIVTLGHRKQLLAPFLGEEREAGRAESRCQEGAVATWITELLTAGCEGLLFGGSRL